MATESSTFPHFEETPNSKQLYVDGKPYLILGAELQNSSMSSAEYMKPIWSKLAAMNINTILGNVTWEQIEPEEGKFDFEQLDLVIRDARAHGFRLVLLWFGSWKNGQLKITISEAHTNHRKVSQHMSQAG
jgi:GH35 family endo-1,4-beta-xylanase